MSSCAATIATTVSRTTDTLHCFNGLQQPQRPHRPKEPEEPQRPQGWMLSFDSHPPTFREEPIFRLFYALNLQSKSLRKLKNSIFRQTKRKKPWYDAGDDTKAKKTFAGICDAVLERRAQTVLAVRLCPNWQRNARKDQENFRRGFRWDTSSKAYDSAICTAYAVATT